MKIGIFGSAQDAQCQAMSRLLRQRGAKVVLVESPAISDGQDFSYTGDGFVYQGQPLEDVQGWYLRYVLSPLPPFFRADDQYVLFSDWYHEYIHRQERYAFQLAMLLSWSARGVPVMNPPEHGGVLQIKTFQLEMARQAGLDIPATLVTNQADRVREFLAETKEVVYKPSMGGAACRPLDDTALQNLEALSASPVIFQQRIPGVDVRVTMVGEKVVSCVRIPSSTLDYRENPAYKSGQQLYIQEHLPEAVRQKCVQMMRASGLLFSGIDFILQEDGRWVFLEANSSPVYMDIEHKTKAPITAALADTLLLLANDPQRYRQALAEAARTKSFVKYAVTE